MYRQTFNDLAIEVRDCNGQMSFVGGQESVVILISCNITLNQIRLMIFHEVPLIINTINASIVYSTYILIVYIVNIK